MPGKKRTYQPHKRRRKSVHGSESVCQPQMAVKFWQAVEKKGAIS